ncbi:class I SAM-dependent methyltransferase family protein [Candidatus Micrarchaeota archaeon]|nr:class I SAM-dependent methyltransferase family protein [Candidatus Micrarchaeota archaeon]
MKNDCIKVEKRKAEETRRKLVSSGVFDKTRRVFSDGKFVFFPVLKKISGFEIVKKKARVRTLKPNSIKEALAGVLSEKELALLVSSFDIVGRVAVLEIPEVLEKKQKQIAEAVMRVHKSVRAVFKKASEMQGVFRVRKLKWLAGEKQSETIYAENNCRMKLDLKKVYFSPRLVFERKRIAELAGENERVLVFFAGVGPFALVIARKHPLAKITCIELNPAACEYARENIELNKAENVDIVEGDVRKIIPASFVGVADRVLMPLPKGAEEFLREAFLAARKGCVVHLYSFAEDAKPFEKALKAVRAEAKKQGRRVKVLCKRVVRPYAPRVSQVVIDFQILN